jgi:pSer/pThr/pTyr-binding forkhead associated (FHA) protein
MRAQLIPIEGGPPVDITKDLVLIGRKEDCDLQLDHKSISKQHCVIVKTSDVLMIRDLGSTNGTRVNGTRVRRAFLLPNDQLHIASLKFRVHMGPGEAPVLAEEHTQQLDAAEVAKLLNKAGTAGDEDDDGDIPAEPVKANVLPDKYPDEPKK